MQIETIILKKNIMIKLTFYGFHGLTNYIAKDMSYINSGTPIRSTKNLSLTTYE